MFLKTDHSKAIQCYRDVLGRKPNNYEALQKLIALLRRAGKLDEVCTRVNFTNLQAQVVGGRRTILISYTRNPWRPGNTSRIDVQQLPSAPCVQISAVSQRRSVGECRVWSIWVPYTESLYASATGFGRRTANPATPTAPKTFFRWFWHVPQSQRGFRYDRIALFHYLRCTRCSMMLLGISRRHGRQNVR